MFADGRRIELTSTEGSEPADVESLEDEAIAEAVVAAEADGAEEKSSGGLMMALRERIFGQAGTTAAEAAEGAARTTKSGVRVSNERAWWGSLQE